MSDCNAAEVVIFHIPLEEICAALFVSRKQPFAVPDKDCMRITKRQIIKLLNRNLTTNVTVMRCLQISCFLASVVILSLAIWNLTRLELTAAQILLGVLMSSLTSMVFIGVGLLLPGIATLTDEHAE